MWDIVVDKTPYADFEGWPISMVWESLRHIKLSLDVFPGVSDIVVAVSRENSVHSSKQAGWNTNVVTKPRDLGVCFCETVISV